MVVIAAGVTYYTGGAASNAFAGYFGATAGSTAAVATTAAGYAVGAAVGSVASQGAGMAMGKQSFSWNAVGQAAIAGAIGGGVSAANPGAAAGLNSTQAAAANAAIASGLNLAIHNDWNWTLVLASAIGAGVGQAAGGAFSGASGFAQDSWQTGMVSGLAGGIAGAAASGESVRYDSVFTSTLGSVIGSSISQQLSGPSYSAEEMAGDYARESSRFASAAAAANGGGASRWDMGSTDYSLASGRMRLGTGSVEPTADELQAGFRASEREYRSANEASVNGAGYVARAGDSISSIVGSSRPQDIGNFMRANGLSSDHVEAGRNYFVPESTTAYGDSATLGQYALNQGNERIEAARVALLLAGDGMRIGPTIERAQALGIYSGNGAALATSGGAYPEMRASMLSPRETAVDWVRSVVGTNRAGNVVAGAVDAWLATPEALSKLPDAVAAIPSGVVQLANGTASVATRLWNDPVATVTDAMASGVNGLRSGFNRAVNGNGFAMGSALYALGTAAVPLGKADGFLGWPGRGGSGPVAGTIGITDSTSTAALRNYYPRGGGVEFVYDPVANEFLAGSPLKGVFDGSPHEQLAQSIGARNNPSLVGGTFQRGPNGEFFTTENSGHYGHNWNNEVRAQFQQWFSGRVNAPVVHETWRP